MKIPLRMEIVRFMIVNLCKRVGWLSAVCLLAIGPKWHTEAATLAAFWEAEGNALDSSGTYDGLISGAVSYAPGRKGEAFELDGSTGWIVAPASTNLTLVGGGTVSAWVWLDQLPSDAGRFMYLVGKSQSGNDCDLQVETDNRARFYIGGGTHVSSTTLMSTGIWYQVAATYRPGEGIELFVNGRSEEQLSTGVLVASNGNPFTIGASTVWAGRNLNGRIDQIRIYEGALTASEIQAVYLDELAQLPAPNLGLRVSQVELCWETATNAVYQLQYRSAVTGANWVAVYPVFWPGTGGIMCTNDAVFAGQPSRFYRLLVTTR
jgi:hypothetical protein